MRLWCVPQAPSKSSWGSEQQARHPPKETRPDMDISSIKRLPRPVIGWGIGTCLAGMLRNLIRQGRRSSRRGFLPHPPTGARKKGRRDLPCLRNEPLFGAYRDRYILVRYMYGICLVYPKTSWQESVKCYSHILFLCFDEWVAHQIIVSVINRPFPFAIFRPTFSYTVLYCTYCTGTVVNCRSKLLKNETVLGIFAWCANMKMNSYNALVL